MSQRSPVGTRLRSGSGASRRYATEPEAFCCPTDACLAAGGVETIGLNVRADNDAALHLYESLDFARHCQFYEALAMP